MNLAPTQSTINTVLRSFLLELLPAGTEVFLGQVNRVPEPSAQDFVVFTPLRRDRIETNVDELSGIVFIGSISGTILTVSKMITPSPFGIGIWFEIGVTPIGYYGPVIKVGLPVQGPGINDATTITSLITGAGGVGTYGVAPSQTVASEYMFSGVGTFLQPTQVTYQIDVHGPNSADNAQVISTMMRDDYAVQRFAVITDAALGIGIGFTIGVSPIGEGQQGQSIYPLYADDPKQIPFQNAEQQYEDRWTIELLIQANHTVSLPQPFSFGIDVGVISVDEAYPQS